MSYIERTDYSTGAWDVHSTPVKQRAVYITNVALVVG